MMSAAGLEAVFLEHRERLRRFLLSHGAGDAADDVLQELWLKVSASQSGPVAEPLSYLFRAANNLMLDRHRSARQATRREADWTDAATTVPGQSDAPPADRALIARQQLGLAQKTLEGLGSRAAAIFRRYRLDGVEQREIAREQGVSLSTVESDLRRAYRAMLDLRKSFDDAE